MLRFLILCLQGAFVGTGAILPGISGGVLCVAFGVYEPMMALLADPVGEFRRSGKTFVPFLLGWVLGFWLLAGGVSLFFEKASAVALALFGGLVFGCIPGRLRECEQKGAGASWTPFVATLAIVFVFLQILDGSALTQITPNAGWYVFCGAVWGLSLVLPGLSSSSVLLFMGLYQPMTQGISQMDKQVLLPLLTGMVLSLLISVRVVQRLMKRHYALMGKLLLGLMLPPSLMILPVNFSDGLEVVLAAAAFLVGFLLVQAMEKAAGRLENR